MTIPALLTEAEAAEALRLCARTLRKARDAGQLSWVQLGRKVLYTESDLATFIERHAMTSTPAISKPPKPAKQAPGGNIVPFSQRGQ